MSFLCWGEVGERYTYIQVFVKSLIHPNLVFACFGFLSNGFSYTPWPVRIFVHAFILNGVARLKFTIPQHCLFGFLLYYFQTQLTSTEIDFWFNGEVVRSWKSKDIFFLVPLHKFQISNLIVVQSIYTCFQPLFLINNTRVFLPSPRSTRLNNLIIETKPE